jgi:hypothetical protein
LESNIQSLDDAQTASETAAPAGIESSDEAGPMNEETAADMPPSDDLESRSDSAPHNSHDTGIAEVSDATSDVTPGLTRDEEPREEEPSAEVIAISLDQIDGSEPEDLVGEYIEPVQRRTGRWVAGSLAALFVMAGQVFWFERDRLSTDPILRPYYLEVCKLVNCQLPDYLDASTLSATDLIIRTHPTAASGLVVDAILRNDAPYRQRFPALLLRFSDIDGNTVAQRTFRPSLYLAGELAGLQYIPAVTEVRLSLDIVDPGPDAVSYSMMTVLN